MVPAINDCMKDTNIETHKLNFIRFPLARHIVDRITFLQGWVWSRETNEWNIMQSCFQCSHYKWLKKECSMPTCQSSIINDFGISCCERVGLVSPTSKRNWRLYPIALCTYGKFECLKTGIAFVYMLVMWLDSRMPVHEVHNKAFPRSLCVLLLMRWKEMRTYLPFFSLLKWARTWAAIKKTQSCCCCWSSSDPGVKIPECLFARARFEAFMLPFSTT